MTLESDSQLVAAVSNGDREAFAMLVTRYARSAIGIATRILNDRHAAEDVAQDAFVTAYGKLNSLNEESAFGPWLMQIVRRKALRARETHQRSRAAPENLPEPFIEDPDPLNNDRQELLNLVEQLPEHERIAVMLRYFDGHSVSDIARIQGTAAGTVTKTLTRARQRLMSRYERSQS